MRLGDEHGALWCTGVTTPAPRRVGGGRAGLVIMIVRMPRQANGSDEWLDLLTRMRDRPAAGQDGQHTLFRGRHVHVRVVMHVMHLLWRRMVRRHVVIRMRFPLEMQIMRARRLKSMHNTKRVRSTSNRIAGRSRSQW